MFIFSSEIKGIDKKPRKWIRRLRPNLTSQLTKMKRISGENLDLDGAGQTGHMTL